MKSGLYLGEVHHARFEPATATDKTHPRRSSLAKARVHDRKPSALQSPGPSPSAGTSGDAGERVCKHKLRYKLFMLAFDLDEIDAMDRGLRFFSHNRFNLMSLHDRDHAGYVRAPIKPQIEAKLRAGGIAWEGGEITLLCMPRLLGYVFNPLSVYFCRHPNGELAALVHEVRNTFGEHHFYVLSAREGAQGEVRQACAKDFFVSPFLEMDLRYEFRVKPPGDSTLVAMTVRRGGEVALTASFAGGRRELSDSTLLRAFAGNPLMTFVAIAGIHWEAVKMLVKGVRFLGRPRARKTGPEPRTV